MSFHLRVNLFKRSIAASFAIFGFASLANAAPGPQVVEGLKFAPRQKDVAFEKVTAAEIEACTSQRDRRNGSPGLFIIGPNGQTLRWFADTNGDGAIDLWSYFNNGVEVYRDLDSDYNGKVDQCRWFGTSGTRWGLDTNEDGQIESWKQISAEEVTMEVVAAIRESNSDRFARILMTPEEIQTLGLGKEKSAELSKRVALAVEEFDKFVKSQKAIDASARWMNFGADKPGVVPAGTDGSLNDIFAYENVMAIVETKNQSEQVLIGSLIQLDTNQWRATDVPRLVGDGTVLTAAGLFFNPETANRMLGSGGDLGLSATSQRLLKELEDLEKQLAQANGDKSELNAQRADVIAGLVEESRNPGDKETWVRQFADTISAAVQAGEYENGLERMKQFSTSIADLDESAKSYVDYRIIQTEYAMQVANGSTANFASIQEGYLDQLEGYVTKYPGAEDTAEAMIQLGLNAELALNLEEAQKWYKLTAEQYGNLASGEKAAGAIARLNLEGRTLDFTGKTLAGGDFDSKKMRGQPYILHYWATWCEPCKKDMAELRRLQAKYAKAKLGIVGINLDTDAALARKFLQQKGNDFPWAHIHDEGAFDSKMAVGLGVFSLPVTIVIDGEGKVIRTATHYSPEIDSLIESTINPPKK